MKGASGNTEEKLSFSTGWSFNSFRTIALSSSWKARARASRSRTFVSFHGNLLEMSMTSFRSVSEAPSNSQLLLSQTFNTLDLGVSWRG